jgi:hypothetical protein
VLTSQRLLQNIARAERTIEQNKVEIARLELPSGGRATGLLERVKFCMAKFLSSLHSPEARNHPLFV